MKEIIMFKCDHCTKKYASKYRTRDHEKECWKNPENQVMQHMRLEQLRQWKTLFISS